MELFTRARVLCHPLEWPLVNYTLDTIWSYTLPNTSTDTGSPVAQKYIDKRVYDYTLASTSTLYTLTGEVQTTRDPQINTKK